MDDDANGQRLAQIRSGLEQVRARITRACEQAGRSTDELTLIVVTKTYPASDVRALLSLGVLDVGENRDQEAAPKAQQLHDQAPSSGLRWHFIGQLQSNKATSVARYAQAVHSVDRSSLVTALGRAAGKAGRTLECLIQVSLDGDVSRGGTPDGQVGELADLIVAQEALRLGGVMAVAPLGTDPDDAFGTLQTVSERLQQTHPGARSISAGMSGDLESAIRHGATHLRVGGAVLGERPPLGYLRKAETE